PSASPASPTKVGAVPPPFSFPLSRSGLALLDITTTRLLLPGLRLFFSALLLWPCLALLDIATTHLLLPGLRLSRLALVDTASCCLDSASLFSALSLWPRLALLDITTTHLLLLGLRPSRLALVNTATTRLLLPGLRLSLFRALALLDSPPGLPLSRLALVDTATTLLLPGLRLLISAHTTSTPPAYLALPITPSTHSVLHPFFTQAPPSRILSPHALLKPETTRPLSGTVPRSIPPETYRAIKHKDQILSTDAELKHLAQQHPELSHAYLGKLRRFKSSLLQQADPSYLERILDELEGVLDQVETELQIRNDETPDSEYEVWLCGPMFSVADVTLVTLLHRLTFLGFSRRYWGTGRRPNLASIISARLNDRLFAVCSVV
uniref:Ganglioside induced differentiation associated protein 1 n=1 Tax=Eptatretus burgeri TaxID=7764 RepID=A0A8C4Q4L4_EPTBU